MQTATNNIGLKRGISSANMKDAKRTKPSGTVRRSMVTTTVDGQEEHAEKDRSTEKTLGTIRNDIQRNSHGKPHVVVPESRNREIHVGDADKAVRSVQLI